VNISLQFRDLVVHIQNS